MNSFLETLAAMPFWMLIAVFLLENVLIMLGVLALGNRLQRKPAGVIFVYTGRQWTIACFTCVLNTVITLCGFWLWQQGYILITIDFSGRIIIDALFLFLVMDLLMFIFHYLIHKTFFYRLLHKLHHEATDPEPLDLFILHPLETLSFGGLWLVLLLVYTLNIYGIFIYLLLNVLFGMMGHLGMEPIPLKIRRLPVFKYIGTSAFHHGHHKHEQYNFGFYTSLWDRLFHTFKEMD